MKILLPDAQACGVIRGRLADLHPAAEPGFMKTLLMPEAA